jgi:hypothetical protein
MRFLALYRWVLVPTLFLVAACGDDAVEREPVLLLDTVSTSAPRNPRELLPTGGWELDPTFADDDNAANTARGNPPMGIGEGTVIEGAIVDKNVRIGRRVRICNDHGWEQTGDSPMFTVRDRIAVVPKDAVVPDGWLPEPGIALG